MDLETITAQLAALQRELLDLPSDAFAERYELQKQQDVLRAQASQFREDWDRQRPTDELLAELAARRSQLKAIEGQRINLVTQAGGGGTGGTSPAGASSYGGVDINLGIGDAQGSGDIQARIGLIKGILEERDIDIPEK